MSSEQDNGATPPPTGGGNQNKNNPGGEKGKPKGGKGKGKGKGKGNGGGKKKETLKGIATLCFDRSGGNPQQSQGGYSWILQVAIGFLLQQKSS